MNPIKPPEVKFSDKRLQTQIELIVYNYKLRCAIAEFRKKWGLEKPEDIKNLSPNNTCRQEVREMLNLFNPPLPDTYENLIYIYAMTNEVDIQPALAFGEDTPFARAYSRKVLQLSGKVNVSPFETRFVKNTKTLPYVEVKVYSVLTVQQRNALLDAIQVFYSELPRHNKFRGSSIPEWSQMADYSREGLSIREIAIKFDDRFGEAVIKTFISRAKRQGL